MNHPKPKRTVHPVRVGNCLLGDGTVYLQSMLNVKAEDVAGNVEQAVSLEAAGCEILRVAVPNFEAVQLISAIKRAVGIPLVADIHFDARIAIACAEAGVDKIRINPGNIGSDERVRQVCQICREKSIPIRIGVNAGSLEKSILQKYGSPTPEALVESALYHRALLHRFDFDDIVISIKASSVQTTVAAYELLAEQCADPLHLGVTEAGTPRMGIVKSAIGIGSLLLRGIGETMRVSLTADPLREIEVGQDILAAVGRGKPRIEVIACPTCGRTNIDLITLTETIEQAVKGCHKPLKVAVMGCVVNGPGEAREADLGIAGGDGCAVLFKKGEVIATLTPDEIVPALLAEIERC